MDLILLKEYMDYRCSMYYWLKSLYLKEPTCETLKEISTICKSYEVDDSIPVKEGQFIEYFAKLKENNINDLKEDIDIEYARLFLGPKKVIAPPYESVYRTSTKRLFGENTNEVRNIYKTMGLEINTLGIEPDDFIGFELEFMYYLSYHTVKMIEEENIAAVQRLLKNQYDFLREHLSCWIAEFTNDIINDTQVEYFKIVADFTNEFVLEDKNVLGELTK
ncbi:MAG: TorD/DmsD family molecular chaperone [Clostridium sp.]